jgi:hypothetical protein
MTKRTCGHVRIVRSDPQALLTMSRHALSHHEHVRPHDRGGVGDELSGCLAGFVT